MFGKESGLMRCLKARSLLTGLSIAIAFLLNHPVSAQKPGPSESPAVRFVDVTAEAGVTFRHIHGGSGEKYFIETMGTGAVFFDYDNDGDVDLYMVNGALLPGCELEVTPTNVLYRNEGDGTFTDVTQSAGAGDTGYGMGCAAADYDNDGDLDLYVTNFGPNVLYRNNGEGTFTDVTERAGVGYPSWSAGCAFLDYDSDGDLDLYVANYVAFHLDMSTEGFTPYMAGHASDWTPDEKTYPDPVNFEDLPDVLYRNNGDGTFTDVTKEAGVFNPHGKGLGVVCGDIDKDGDIDIYVANDETRNFLYRNNGDGTFTDIGFTAGVGYDEDGQPQAGMGVDLGDYDNDGDLDIVVANFQNEVVCLYRNEYGGFFIEVSFFAGIGRNTMPYVNFGTGFLDYDNDGDLDLFVANGHVLDNVALLDPTYSYGQPNNLFRNDSPGRAGRHTFTDVGSISGEGLQIKKVSRGTTFGDYDNDGDVDMLVLNSNDTATLLRNDGGNRNNYLIVKTVGTKSNRDGIGARVKVVAGDLTQIREVKSGSSYMSQNDTRLLFGLGDRAQADLVEVRWPSGTVDGVEQIPARQLLIVEEGKGIVQMTAF